MEYEGDGNIDYNWCTWNDSQRRGKGTEWVIIGGRAENIQTTKL